MTNKLEGHVYYEITVPGKPLGKQRPRLGRNGKAYTSQQTRDNETKIAKAAAKVIHEPFVERGVCVTVECYFSSKVHSDIDNVIKSAMDGMNGIAYTDDKLVDELHGFVFYCEKGEERMVIKVSGETPDNTGGF